MSHKARLAVVSITLCLFVPLFAFASSNTSLHLGSRGSEVTMLQQFLVSQGLLSSKDTNGYFGKRTQKALAVFQRRNGIVPASGIFGPLTRNRVLAIWGMGGISSSTSQQFSPGATGNYNPMSANQTTGGGTYTTQGNQTGSWNAPAGGEILYAENLPSCIGTQLFTSPPAVAGTYNTISPIGHTSSYSGVTGHVFPVDHMSFDLNHVTPGDRTTPSLPATLLAPGDVELFQVSHTTYEKDGQVTGNDYTLAMAPCREVTLYLGHVTSISSKIQDAIDHADQKNCRPPFTTGGVGSQTFNVCTYGLLLNLKSGEQIGTAGGPGVMTQGFDYGVYDQRIPPLPFVDPKYWTPQNLHAVCGLHYYADGPIKTALLNNINNTKKDVDGFPDCGTNMWDKAGTIQGNWVLPNTPTGKVPDPQGLSIIHLYTDPSQGLIDWGGAIAPTGTLTFPITSTGVINRDPTDVKADGSVYCFQDLSFGAAYAQSIMMQLVDDDTLKAEYVKGACPSSPVFSNATTYVR